MRLVDDATIVECSSHMTSLPVL